MTPEERRMLEESLEIAKSNAEILRVIQKTNRISLGLKITYWVVIIGLSLGAFYFVQPYVDTLKGSIQDITGGNGLTGLN